jgi:hypothetical protein
MGLLRPFAQKTWSIPPTVVATPPVLSASAHLAQPFRQPKSDGGATNRPSGDGAAQGPAKMPWSVSVGESTERGTRAPNASAPRTSEHGLGSSPLESRHSLPNKERRSSFAPPRTCVVFPGQQARRPIAGNPLENDNESLSNDSALRQFASIAPAQRHESWMWVRSPQLRRAHESVGALVFHP